MSKVIKILQITSVVIAVAAAAFLLFGAAFSSKGDDHAREFINAPDALEKFKKAKKDKRQKDADHTSPLVKQARLFALYLNPPPAPEPAKPSKTAPKSQKTPTSPRPKTVSAKFELVGTSYYPLDPNLSFALIDQPGAGLRWVRQFSKVGHLVIEQIENGAITIKDGTRTYPVVAKRPPRRTLLKSEGPSAHKAETSPHTEGAEAVLSALSKVGADLTAEHAPQVSATKNAQAAIDKTRPGHQKPGTSELVDPEEFRQMDEFINKLKTLRASASSKQEANAMIEELMSGLKAGRVGTREAEKLDNLGKILNDTNDPNRTKTDKIQKSKPRRTRPRRTRKR